MLYLYIDDERTPSTNKDWIIKRNSADSIAFMTENGCPDYISFDHDLGGDDTSIIIVNWMIERDLDSNGDFIPVSFDFNVHSANPVGAKNIESKLTSYFKIKYS